MSRGSKARRRGGGAVGGGEASVTIRPLAPGDWPLVVRLFGERGACGGCWCMWPRVPRGGKAWEESKGSMNRERFRRLVRSGKVHAVLAFSGEEPVGWCSFGPSVDFPRLGTIRDLRGVFEEATWCVVCFYLPAPWRGRGVASRLLRAAAERALALGAPELQGYPVAPKDATRPVPAAFAWTGVPALFRRAGFRRVRRPAGTRPVYRLRP